MVEPAPVRVVVPVPTWVSAPLPLSTLAKVLSSVRLMDSVALSITLPARPPPLPISSVPALMVVAPVKVLRPVSVSVSVPVLMRLPAPPMTPPKLLAVSLLAVSGAPPRVTLPAPLSWLAVWAKPLRSSTPPAATFTALLVAKALAMPVRKVPASTLVAPV